MRRCTGNACLASAGARSVNLDLPVATVLMNPRQEWAAISHGGDRIRVAHKLDADWSKYNPDNFLFTHCSIVASVATEENGYHILPACSDLVNNNGNAWTNGVLMATFRSFVGAENYLEHVQVPELSKGKILDAALRPLQYKDEKGHTADVYFCDILVATARKHRDIVAKVEGGKLTTLSMGCNAAYVTCSRCGKVLGDSDPNCRHLESELLDKFVDENGVERITAELCGRMIRKGGKLIGDPDSCKFIEASWVEHPAFTGAVLNHYLIDPPKVAANILAFPTSKLAETVNDLFRLRVADRHGMIVLNVARAELMRRKREAMIERLAGSVR